MIEILAGSNFENAVNSLDLNSAVKTFHYHNEGKDYQIWELSEDDFDKLEAVDDEDWGESWGWWRFSDGSNLGPADQKYIIHGQKILAWDGLRRNQFAETCEECGYYHAGCDASKYKQDGCIGLREHHNLLSYILHEIGASTETNICAIATDLAHQNNMKLSELFSIYLGE